MAAVDTHTPLSTSGAALETPADAASSFARPFADFEGRQEGRLHRRKVGGRWYRQAWAVEWFEVSAEFLVSYPSRQTRQVEVCIPLTAVTTVEPCATRRLPGLFRVRYVITSVEGATKVAPPRELLLRAEDVGDVQLWLGAIFEGKARALRGAACVPIDCARERLVDAEAISGSLAARLHFASSREAAAHAAAGAARAEAAAESAAAAAARAEVATALAQVSAKATAARRVAAVALAAILEASQARRCHAGWRSLRENVLAAKVFEVSTRGTQQAACRLLAARLVAIQQCMVRAAWRRLEKHELEPSSRGSSAGGVRAGSLGLQVLVATVCDESDSGAVAQQLEAGTQGAASRKDSVISSGDGKLELESVATLECQVSGVGVVAMQLDARARTMLRNCIGFATSRLERLCGNVAHRGLVCGFETLAVCRQATLVVSRDLAAEALGLSDSDDSDVELNHSSENVERQLSGSTLRSTSLHLVATVANLSAESIQNDGHQCFASLNSAFALATPALGCIGRDVVQTDGSIFLVDTPPRESFYIGSPGSPSSSSSTSSSSAPECESAHASSGPLVSTASSPSPTKQHMIELAPVGTSLNEVLRAEAATVDAVDAGASAGKMSEATLVHVGAVCKEKTCAEVAASSLHDAGEDLPGATPEWLPCGVVQNKKICAEGTDAGMIAANICDGLQSVGEKDILASPSGATPSEPGPEPEPPAFPPSPCSAASQLQNERLRINPVLSCDSALAMPHERWFHPKPERHFIGSPSTEWGSDAYPSSDPSGFPYSEARLDASDAVRKTSGVSPFSEPGSSVDIGVMPLRMEDREEGTPQQRMWLALSQSRSVVATPQAACRRCFPGSSNGSFCESLEHSDSASSCSSLNWSISRSPGCSSSRRHRTVERNLTSLRRAAVVSPSSHVALGKTSAADNLSHKSPLHMSSFLARADASAYTASPTAYVAVAALVASAPRPSATKAAPRPFVYPAAPLVAPRPLAYPQAPHAALGTMPPLMATPSLRPIGQATASRGPFRLPPPPVPRAPLRLPPSPAPRRLPPPPRR